MPYQSENDLPYSLSAADVHWLSHKPEFEGLLFPSKFYGIAAVGRPIIAITSSQSELAKLVSQYQCGLVIKQGDGKTLALELKRLRAAPEVCSAMGAHARAMLSARFTRAHAINTGAQTLRGNIKRPHLLYLTDAQPLQTWNARQSILPRAAFGALTAHNPREDIRPRRATPR
jgi:hypothetical protein